MSTELATQNQLQEVVVSGSEILQKSEIRVAKAISVGDKLLKEIQEQGMNAELDERCNKFLVNCRNAKSEIETQRKPITTFFDTIRKQFTEIEGKLDPKKSETLPTAIQYYRDAYVKKLREEEIQNQKIAQAKIDKQNEIIDIKAVLENQLSVYVQNHVSERKQKLQNSFNAITLDIFEAKSKALKTLLITYDKLHFDAFSPMFVRQLVSQEELTCLLNEFMASKDYTLISAVVVQEIQAFKKELIDRLPSLKISLDEMAKAGAEEQERLASEKAKREADAEAKIKADADAKIKADAEAAEVKKVADQTNAMMNGLSVSEAEIPQTRDGYKIVLLHQSAAAEIFTFWFQREGMNLTIEEIEKKSIGQMKAFCEKVGHKTGDLIVSKNVKYESVYKAVNRK